MIVKFDLMLPSSGINTFEFSGFDRGHGNECGNRDDQGMSPQLFQFDGPNDEVLHGEDIGYMQCPHSAASQH